MLKILVILDPPDGLQLTLRLLRRCRGYQVFGYRLDTPRTDDAKNLEVIQWIEQEQPDLIIVENSCFFAAIPQLKNNPKTQSIPVLIHGLPVNSGWLKILIFDDHCEPSITNPVKLINKIEVLLKQKTTIELILELMLANPQGLTLKEIEHQIDRGFLKRTLDSLVDERRVRTRNPKGQFIYHLVQQKPTIELILELIQANPQGLTIDEIKNKTFRRRPIKLYLKILVESRRIKTKEQEGQLIYYPVQKDNRV
jgi:CheY-like chemotaxis protein